MPREADGGTDTMVPYANGVWVDAKGVLQPKKSRAANKIVGAKKEIAEPIALLDPPHGRIQAICDGSR